MLFSWNTSKTHYLHEIYVRSPVTCQNMHFLERKSAQFWQKTILVLSQFFWQVQPRLREYLSYRSQQCFKIYNKNMSSSLFDMVNLKIKVFKFSKLALWKGLFSIAWTSSFYIEFEFHQVSNRRVRAFIKLDFCSSISCFGLSNTSFLGIFELQFSRVWVLWVKHCCLDLDPCSLRNL